jgi:hypothetical protein
MDKRNLGLTGFLKVFFASLLMFLGFMGGISAVLYAAAGINHNFIEVPKINGTDSNGLAQVIVMALIFLSMFMTVYAVYSISNISCRYCTSSENEGVIKRYGFWKA